MIRAIVVLSDRRDRRDRRARDRLFERPSIHWTRAFVGALPVHRPVREHVLFLLQMRAQREMSTAEPR